MTFDTVFEKLCAKGQDVGLQRFSAKQCACSHQLTGPASAAVAAAAAAALACLAALRAAASLTHIFRCPPCRQSA